jgi:type IV secretion system protein VirD4
MMNRSPGSLTIVAWLAGLIFIGSVLYTGFVGWNNLNTATDALVAKGWAKFVNAQPGPSFVVRCFFSPRCSQVLNKAWGNPIPETMLYLPFFSMFTLVVVRVLGSRFRPAAKDPGEARWAEKKDLASYLLDTPGGSPRVGYLGLLESKYLVRPPENLRCAHTLVIGGTGAGKTTRYVNPNLLTDAKEGVSAVVFDLKYPDPKAGFLEAINYFKAWGRAVHPFTPFDPDSVRIPLLADVKTVQDAMDVAAAFRPAGGEETEAAFYRNNERQLLAGLVLGISQDPDPSMYRIYQLLGGGIDELIKYVNARPNLKPILGTLLELRKDNLTGIATGLMGDLQPFLNPNLNRATSAGPGQTLALEEICRRPGFLYIGIPQEEIQGGQGQVLLRLIKRILDRAILNVCGQNEGRLPVHLSIYLDEFPSFGALPNIAENLATMRSRRVAYHIAMQNLAQGQAIYGREEFAGMINNNFAQMVVFPRSLRLEDAQFFAEIFGETTATEISTSKMQTGSIMAANPFGEVRRAQSIKEVKRFLLSSEAMRTFPDGFAVIETIGSPPAKVEMPRLDQRQNPYSSVYARIKKTYATPRLRKPGVFAASTAPSKDVLISNTSPLPGAQIGIAQSGASGPNPFAESFRTWFGSLIERNIAMNVELDGDKPVMVSIERGDLEPLPSDLAQWVEKGWVSDGQRVLIPHLGLSRVTKFWSKLIERAGTQSAQRPQPSKGNTGASKIPAGSSNPNGSSKSSKPNQQAQTALRESPTAQRAAPQQDPEVKPVSSQLILDNPAPRKPVVSAASPQRTIKTADVVPEQTSASAVLEQTAPLGNSAAIEGSPELPAVNPALLENASLKRPALSVSADSSTEPTARPRPPRIGGASQAVKK